MLDPYLPQEMISTLSSDHQIVILLRGCSWLQSWVGNETEFWPPKR